MTRTCACKILERFGEHAHEISYCPTHAAAREMAELLAVVTDERI